MLEIGPSGVAKPFGWGHGRRPAFKAGRRSAAPFDRLNTLSLSKCKVNSEPLGLSSGRRQAQALDRGVEGIDLVDLKTRFNDSILEEKEKEGVLQ